MQSRTLPALQTLALAVTEVIRSNKADGYNPVRFAQATEYGYAKDLVTRCENLILKGETLAYLDGAIRVTPTLVTLEDFVTMYGLKWGLGQDAVDQAAARVEYFDKLAGFKRYVSA